MFGVSPHQAEIVILTTGWGLELETKVHGVWSFEGSQSIVNPKEPVNLCTKTSFNSNEPSKTKDTSKVYKEGDTLNDIKVDGVNDIITYDDISCSYDNDNNNVIVVYMAHLSLK